MYELVHGLSELDLTPVIQHRSFNHNGPRSSDYLIGDAKEDWSKSFHKRGALEIKMKAVEGDSLFKALLKFSVLTDSIAYVLQIAAVGPPGDHPDVVPRLAERN
ncbi:MAG: hypothetical protein ACYC8T_36725 [Myxococcaceae bacterium]